MLRHRLTWAVVPAASLGMLAWAPFAYLVLTRGRRRDRNALAVTLFLSGIELLAMMGVDGDHGRSAHVGAAMIFYGSFAAVMAWGALAPPAPMPWGDGTPITSGARAVRRTYAPVTRRG